MGLGWLRGGGGGGGGRVGVRGKDLPEARINCCEAIQQVWVGLLWGWDGRRGVGGGVWRGGEKEGWGKGGVGVRAKDMTEGRINCCEAMQQVWVGLLWGWGGPAGGGRVGEGGVGVRGKRHARRKNQLLMLAIATLFC